MAKFYKRHQVRRRTVAKRPPYKRSTRRTARKTYNNRYPRRSGYRVGRRPVMKSYVKYDWRKWLSPPYKLVLAFNFIPSINDAQAPARGILGHHISNMIGPRMSIWERLGTDIVNGGRRLFVKGFRLLGRVMMFQAINGISLSKGQNGKYAATGDAAQHLISQMHTRIILLSTSHLVQRNLLNAKAIFQHPDNPIQSELKGRTAEAYNKLDSPKIHRSDVITCNAANPEKLVDIYYPFGKFINRDENGWVRGTRYYYILIFSDVNTSLGTKIEKGTHVGTHDMNLEVFYRTTMVGTPPAFGRGWEGN